MGREGLPPQGSMGVLISTSWSFGKLNNIFIYTIRKRKDISERGRMCLQLLDKIGGQLDIHKTSQLEINVSVTIKSDNEQTSKIKW